MDAAVDAARPGRRASTEADQPPRRRAAFGSHRDRGEPGRSHDDTPALSGLTRKRAHASIMAAAQPRRATVATMHHLEQSAKAMFDEDPLSALEAITAAQHLAFAPLAFQAALVMRDRGILAALAKAAPDGLSIADVSLQTTLPPF